MAIQQNERKDAAAALLHVNMGDRLIFRIIMRQGTPLFALVDASHSKTLLVPQDQPVDGGIWERQWPLPADPVSLTTNCSIGFNFLNAAHYTYQVEHHSPGGMVSLIDIDYVSQGSEPSFFKNLQVFVV